jgi:hypothetical protein
MTANPVSNADDDFIAGSQNRLRTVAELRAATDYLVTNATVNDYESIRLRWDADTLVLATNDLATTTTLDELLHAYLYIRALQVDSEATLRIVIDFAETSFTFDQLITATAALCLEYPDMQEYIAVELLRNVAPYGGEAKYHFACAELPHAAYSVATYDTDILEFFTLHQASFGPLTNAQLALAEVLFDDWSGTTLSLVETIRQLRPIDQTP